MGTKKRFIVKTGIDNNNQTIVNVADPVNPQDVATKSWATSSFARALPSDVISTSTTAVPFKTYVITSALTLTLPETPDTDDIIRIVDLSSSSSVLIARNGNNINNIASDISIDYTNARLTLQYVNSTIGWLIV